MNGREEYIFNGRLYSVGDSLLLCDVNDAFGSVRLYRTKAGSFFTVTGGDLQRTTVDVLIKEDVQKFLNKFSAYIIAENYIKAFGAVEKA